MSFTVIYCHFYNRPRHPLNAQILNLTACAAGKHNSALAANPSQVQRAERLSGNKTKFLQPFSCLSIFVYSYH